MTTEATFPTQMPSNFGMFTIDGNAAAASMIAEELRQIGEFLPASDASIVTTSIANRLERLGHDEAWDTMTRDMIYACLVGETHEFLGLDTVAS